MSEFTIYHSQPYQNPFSKIAHETLNHLEDISSTASSEQWMYELNALAAKYTCSTRNYLMLFLENQSNADKSQNTYAYTFKRKKYQLPIISTISVIENLSDDDIEKYVDLFSRISSSNDSGSQSSWKKLYQKAIGGGEGLLTKQEAFRIGHGLKFTYQEMEQFLIRALHNDGISLSKSEDLIEAFCFLYDKANFTSTAKSIKEKYNSYAKTVEKVPFETKSEQYTKTLFPDLRNMIQVWQSPSPEETIEQFVDWLKTQSPFLDLPSKKAYETYRNLVGCAYELLQTRKKLINMYSIHKKYDAEQDERQTKAFINYSDKIKESLLQNGYYKSSVLNYDTLDYTAIVEDFCSDIRNFSKLSNNIDIHNYLRYVSLNTETGNVEIVFLGKRMPKLLYGKTFIEKADILFILWYLLDIVWRIRDEFSDYNTSKETIIMLPYDRIADFCQTANNILSDCALPPLYVPHILEQAFLKALLYTEGTDEILPFEYYGYYCDYMLPKREKQTRNRETKVDPKETKTKRRNRRQEIKKNYPNYDFKGLDKTFSDFAFQHINKYSKYFFMTKGIYYTSNKNLEVPTPAQKVAIPYPNQETGKYFDMNDPMYKSEEYSDYRETLMYSLELHLREHSPFKKLEFTCRIYSKANAIMHIDPKEDLSGY